MNCILVVDDEAIQRRVLSGMIRSVRPECRVIEASNGRKALEAIDSEPVDAVITDIKMPIMDGFDFIEHSRRGRRQLKIIILSGYRYFEYAQKALQLGAFDYLLKPVREESIVQMLDKVEASLREERSSLMEKEQLAKRLDTTLPVYYERLLSEWIAGRLSAAKRDELKTAFSLKEAGTVIVSRIHLGAPEDTGQEEEAGATAEPDQLKQSVIEALNRGLSPLGQPVSFVSPDDTRSIVTVFTTGSAAEADHPAGTAMLEAVHKEVSGLCGGAGDDAVCTMGVGRPRGDIIAEAAGSYAEALEAEARHFYQSADGPIRYGDADRPLQRMSGEASKDEETLKELIKLLKADAFEQHIHEMLNKITEEGFPFPDQLKARLIRLTGSLAETVKDMMNEEDYRQLVMQMERQIKECRAFGQLHGILAGCGGQLIAALQSMRSRKHELTADKCAAFIDAHYMEDLSLEAVAGRFYFSPNYLSMVFKNQLGTTFVKYLSGVRLNKAVRLLEESDLKVYEIAARTGFKDEKYFYRVFKRKYGVTPDEYRRLLRPAANGPAVYP
ncbi:response regulator transcription factor [Paenibacillus konkukensis]|nr:response regulator [Paenibacillus konkukensis]